MFQIQNEEITLKTASLGGEMKSLRDNQTGREYLWQGDPKYWGRTSPILFPLVGNYKNKESHYQGKNYTLSQHGFARDMEFALLSQKEDEIWFQLESDQDTREKYPFDFRLSLGYRLEGRKVLVLWRVENPGNETMYFSIGGHPAFLCPIKEGQERRDYKLSFDAEGTLKSRLLNDQGTVTETIREYPLEQKKMQISEDLFEGDALIFEDGQIHQVSLETPEQEVYLTVSFDAPVAGIWSPKGKNAPFVCIEPWYGRSDGENFEGTLAERAWGNCLEPGGVFERQYEIWVKK